MYSLSSLYFTSIVLVLFLAFFGGSYALEVFGIQYVSEGGSALYKIHLYSYVSLGVSLIYFLRSGLSKTSRDLGKLFKPWFFFLLSIVYLIMYGLVKFGTSGMAYVVDTLLVPVLIFPVLFTLSFKQIQHLAKILFLLLCLNCGVAIYEYGAGIQVFPFEYEEHWVYFRSTAFLSHPLNNALIVSFLAIFLYQQRFINPVVLFLLVSLALFCFGARTATFFFIILSLFELFRFYKQRYQENNGLGYREFLVIKLVILLGSAVIFYAVFYLNFGQRIFENIALDGSARSRLDVFNVFQYLSFSEYIFGATSEIFENLSLYIDNAVVENFVIGWFLFYGILGSLPIILCFYRFVFALFSVGGQAEKFAILAFALISISNNSLASKTPALLFLLVSFAASVRFNDRMVGR